MNSPDAFLSRRKAGEELRITGEPPPASAHLSIVEAVRVATDYLLATGADLAVYESVRATFYEAGLPSYVDVPDLAEPAWLLWFRLGLAPGVDLFPDYAEIIVGDAIGQVYEPPAKKTGKKTHGNQRRKKNA